MKTVFELREISQFNTFEILRIDLKMIAVALKELFGFSVTVVVSFPKVSNSKAMEETDCPCSD